MENIVSDIGLAITGEVIMRTIETMLNSKSFEAIANLQHLADSFQGDLEQVFSQV